MKQTKDCLVIFRDEDLKKELSAYMVKNLYPMVISKMLLLEIYK